MSGLLNDTAALIKLAGFGEASAAAEAALSQAGAVQLSPISAWEIGDLAAKGGLRLSMSPKAWVERAMAKGNLTWAPMPADLLLAATVLPGEPAKDPPLRIILATAREYGLRLITGDSRILDYAARGHVMAIEC